MTVFVDTSALLAILDGDDRFHQDASRVFRHLAGQTELLTHNYVHLETHALASRRLGTEVARRLVDELLPALATHWVDQPLHDAATAAWRSSASPASLTDHVSFELMRRRSISEAFTFDSDFQVMGFARPRIPGSPADRHRLAEHAELYAEAGATGELDVVSVAEIAARSGRPISTIQSWRRRHPDFPVPVASLAAGPVWTWPVVERWIKARRGLGHRTGPHRLASSRSEAL